MALNRRRSKKTTNRKANRSRLPKRPPRISPPVKKTSKKHSRPQPRDKYDDYEDDYEEDEYEDYDETDEEYEEDFYEDDGEYNDDDLASPPPLIEKYQPDSKRSPVRIPPPLTPEQRAANRRNHRTTPVPHPPMELTLEELTKRDTDAVSTPKPPTSSPGKPDVATLRQMIAGIIENLIISHSITVSEPDKKKLIDHTRAELNDHVRNYMTLRKRGSLERNRKDQLVAIVKNLESQIARMKALNTISTQSASAEELNYRDVQIDNLKKQVEQLEETLDESRIKIKRLEEHNAEMRERVELAEWSETTLKQQIEELKTQSARQDASSASDSSSDSQPAVSEQLETLREENKRLEAERTDAIHQKESDADTAKKKIGILKQTIVQLKDHIESLEAENRLQANDIRNLKKTLSTYDTGRHEAIRESAGTENDSSTADSDSATAPVESGESPAHSADRMTEIADRAEDAFARCDMLEEKAGRLEEELIALKANHAAALKTIADLTEKNESLSCRLEDAELRAEALERDYLAKMPD